MKNYTIKVKESRKVVAKYQTHSKRRILNKISTIKWKVGVSKAHLRVNYGKFKNNYGRNEVFDNEGIYNNKKDLLIALNSFNELSEKDFL